MMYLGHFNSYPYGATPRTTTGFASSASLRDPFDASTGNSSQSAASNDPYAAFLFAQDPMLGIFLQTTIRNMFYFSSSIEFVSRLVNNQQTSTTPPINTSNSPFFFAPSTTTHVPSSTTTAAEIARLQQLENNDAMFQIKYIFLPIFIH